MSEHSKLPTELEVSPMCEWGMSVEDSLGRRYDEPVHAYRTEFQRDRDRIVHSTAFRRLQYKTQVFVIHEGDYYRTRLTHTNEVSQMARTISRALGLNMDLSEAIALGHDLGHTPFGHSGEQALNEKLKEQGSSSGFKHNHQSLRVLDTLENKYPDYRGLNLTWELRESIIKHGFPERKTEKEEYEPDWAPLLEARVVDVTDSIAYSNHDLDDGLKSGILQREELREVEIWARAENEIQKQHGEQPDDIERSQIVRYLINWMVTDLIESTMDILEENEIENVRDVRAATMRLVRFSSEVEHMKKELTDFLYDRMYGHHRVVRMQERSKRIVRRLFDEFHRCPELLPDEYQEWIDTAGKNRGIADYIAGMTDRYAIQEHDNILGSIS